MGYATYPLSRFARHCFVYLITKFTLFAIQAVNPCAIRLTYAAPLAATRNRAYFFIKRPIPEHHFFQRRATRSMTARA
jgi:hypothetical protein